MLFKSTTGARTTRHWAASLARDRWHKRWDLLRLPHRLLRKSVTGIAVLSLLAPILAAPLAAQGGGARQITRAEYEACQSRDEAGFRAAIETVTIAALQRGLAGTDYRAIVDEEWRKGSLDDVMARRVDAAIDELRGETSWTELITSLASKETAKQLATSAAERVYRSDEMKRAIERLATAVGREVGKRIELTTADTAEPATQCLKAFLGPRYGATVAATIARDAGREFLLEPGKAAASVSSGQVLLEGREGLTGAVILIVRRQLANLATRIGQRLIGAVLGRLVAVVAGGVGVVLIAKDVWELRHGVLPIIATEMKSPATRDKVEDELAKALGEQINEHVKDIGAKSAERVVEIWREFRNAHAKVLELAEQNDGFRSFLDTVAPTRLGRLDEVVALVLATEGQPAILARLGNGTLREAVVAMDEDAFGIARDMRALEPAFQWRALAGDLMPKVVKYEIHRRASPKDLSRASLARVLALDDALAISRVAALAPTVRNPLLEMEPGKLRALARTFGEADLNVLAGYLTKLEPQARVRLMTAVSDHPAKLVALSVSGAREAVLASKDQSAALGVLLRPDAVFDFVTFYEDVTLVRAGRISPGLIWVRYPVAIGVLGVLALAILALLWRLIRGRRPRIIVTSSGSKS